MYFCNILRRYKLFTSVPVQDIGAFAPRDYTKVKSVPAAELHNYHASDHIPKTCELPLRAIHFANADCVSQIL